MKKLEKNNKGNLPQQYNNHEIVEYIEDVETIDVNIRKKIKFLKNMTLKAKILILAGIIALGTVITGYVLIKKNNDKKIDPIENTDNNLDNDNTDNNDNNTDNTDNTDNNLDNDVIVVDDKDNDNTDNTDNNDNNTDNTDNTDNNLDNDVIVVDDKDNDNNKDNKDNKDNNNNNTDNYDKAMIKIDKDKQVEAMDKAAKDLGIELN